MERCHRETYEIMEKKRLSKVSRVDSTPKIATVQSNNATKSQSISECLTRHIEKWPDNSAEYHKRQDALVDMLIETGAFFVHV